MTYAIFKVYDYKGGELSSSLNLDKESFIEELSSIFENNFDEDIEKDLESVKEFINNCLIDDDLLSEYAGGDGFCGKIYEVDGDNMRQLKINDYLEDVAQYIFDNWFDNSESFDEESFDED
jgi:hypothetical protein